MAVQSASSLVVPAVTEPRHSAILEPEVDLGSGQRFAPLSLDDDAASEDEEFVTSFVHNETAKQGAYCTVRLRKHTHGLAIDICLSVRPSVRHTRAL